MLPSTRRSFIRDTDVQNIEIGERIGLENTAEVVVIDEGAEVSLKIENSELTCSCQSRPE